MRVGHYIWNRTPWPIGFWRKLQDMHLMITVSRKTKRFGFYQTLWKHGCFKRHVVNASTEDLSLSTPVTGGQVQPGQRGVQREPKRSRLQPWDQTRQVRVHGDLHSPCQQPPWRGHCCHHSPSLRQGWVGLADYLRQRCAHLSLTYG